MTTQTPGDQPPEELPPNFRTPLTDDFPTGPEVGERILDFTLPDQHGQPVNLTTARGGNRALLVFHRSARW